MKPGLLVVLSAPSGAGKATVLGRLAERGAALLHPISVTTRHPREGEREGREYYFRSRKAFEALLAEGAFVEWADVHGNLYGTLRSELQRCIQAGHDTVLELDVQGMRNLRQAGMNPVTIFLAPPAIEELEQRLRKRGKDDDATIRIRLENAREEMRAQKEYDYVVVNNDLEEAVAEIEQLLKAERAKRG